MISYYDLEQRRGPAFAYQCLLEIEKATRIRSDEVLTLDPEERMARAIDAQDRLCQAV